MQRYCHHKGTTWITTVQGQFDEPWVKALEWTPGYKASSLWVLEVDFCPFSPNLPLQQYQSPQQFQALSHLSPCSVEKHFRTQPLDSRPPIGQPWVPRLTIMTPKGEKAGPSAACDNGEHVVRQAGSLESLWQWGFNSISIWHPSHAHRLSIVDAENLPCPLLEMNSEAILIFSAAQKLPPTAQSEQYH